MFCKHCDKWLDNENDYTKTKLTKCDICYKFVENDQDPNHDQDIHWKYENDEQYQYNRQWTSSTKGEGDVNQITYIKCNTCGNQEEVSNQPSGGGQGQERLNACSDQYNKTERIDKGNKDYCQCLLKCERHRRELGFNYNCKTCKRLSENRERERERESKSTQQTKSQMKCSNCNYKKDWTEADGIPLKCPKCGELAGNKFDIYEVPITEKDSSKNWTPWVIGGGIILILVVGIIAYFLGKSKGDKQ